MHVAHVLEGLWHSNFYPGAMRRCRQPSDQRLAALVALHEGNNLTSLEMVIITLGLEVAGARQSQKQRGQNHKVCVSLLPSAKMTCPRICSRRCSP